MPVGLLAAAVTWSIYRRRETLRRKLPIDTVGLSLLVLWMRSHLSSETDFAHILVPTLLQGAATAFFFIPLTTIALAGIERERLPAAAGLSNFVRNMAGAMGTWIATTLWESRAAMHHAHLTELLKGQGAFAWTIEGLRASGLSEQQALAQINRMIDQQAYTRAADDIFLGSAGVFVMMIALVWLTHRPARAASGSARPPAVPSEH